MSRSKSSDRGTSGPAFWSAIATAALALCAGSAASGCQTLLGLDSPRLGDPAGSCPDSGPAGCDPPPPACQANPDACGDHGVCRNANDPGDSYTCQCDAGYRFDGATCADIDECAEGGHDCDANASCSNRDGSFDCACDNGYIGDGRSCALPTSCQELNLAGHGDGVYLLDVDGSGTPIEVYCKNSIAGGGWQLISARTADTGSLFASEACLDPTLDCSGALPAAQVSPGLAPDLLFATADDQVWLHVTGLEPPESDALLAVLTLQRPLAEDNSCTYPHYCGSQLDVGLQAAASSASYTPRFTELSSQYSRVGGLWFGNGGGSAPNHVVSLNYSPYCAPGGIHFSDASDATVGNVVCGQPGAVYFRY